MLLMLFNNKFWRSMGAFGLLCCCFISAQAQYLSLDSNRNHMTIPFVFIRNLVVIKLKINNRGPFNFVLDTGVGQMLITDPSLVDSLNLVSKRTIRISGYGEGDDFDAYITPPLNVSIKGMSSHFISAAIFKKDFFGLSNYAGMRIHGLLGYEFFNHFLVKVDFSDSTVTAYRPEKASNFKNWDKIPLNIEENRPYLETKVTCDDGSTKSFSWISVPVMR
jgi:Aspartyl protease